ncbi:MAG: prolyl oligopeptidase family serine peptidase [Clostridia bacterium]|nr:prolyl oligopeptidase family serine peptidase [Clostridia bacterium]
MKKSILMIIAIVLLLCACGSNDIPDNAPPATENYANVDALLENDNIASITKDNYALLSSMDLSQLPESVSSVYREILEDIITYQVLYNVDDCTVSAFISLPKDYESKDYPLVIYNRGGNGNFSSLNAESVAIYTQALNCVIIASNYRETTPGTGVDEFGGKDVNDVVFWMNLIPELDFIEKESVYMIGESRGGMQTCLALLNDNSNVIKAAACISGVYDVTDIYDSRADMQEMLVRRIGGTPEQCPEEYQKRSAINFVDQIKTPLIIVHSTGDAKVPYAQAQEFVAALEASGKAVEFITREDNYHCITSSDEIVNIFEQLKNIVE